MSWVVRARQSCRGRNEQRGDSGQRTELKGRAGECGRGAGGQAVMMEGAREQRVRKRPHRVTFSFVSTGQSLAQGSAQ